ncbi:tail fiber domain-containing protein [Methylobacterium terricola]|uniref:Tail fiber domain-containing protein n=1 Tax=Methylobacterium terricola TaxID=2583531 RepID=A0A5C4LF53_9HYPH|nr:tail fiber domain-containing protein [Methylobacterium terricola]TNC10825.1 tail fiber domain-containing protein [Methylobacterium terricola]
MSKKGNDTPATTTTVQKVELPAWVEEAGKNNYAQAQQVSANLAHPYTGNTVAGQNQDQFAAYDTVRSGGNLAMPSMQTAGNTLNSVQGYGGQQIGAGKFTDANLGQYMSPYTQSVIQAAQKNEAQTLAQNLNNIGTAATQAGAYGGSRQAIQEGAAQAQSALNMGQLTAQLQNQNFQQAQAAIGQDQNRQFQADQSNQSNGLEAQRLRALAAAQGASVGQQAQQANLQQAAALQSIGDSQRAYGQDLLNQDYQRYADQRQYPIDQLNILQYGLGVTPYGSTTTGTSTQTGGQQGSNGLGQILGGAGSLLSSFLPMFGLLSDENEKRDIVRLGTDPATGTRVSAWNYKSDPAGTPSRIGPTAQDLEKTMPGAVAKTPGGPKMVDARVSQAVSGSFLSGPNAKPPAKPKSSLAAKAPTVKLKAPKKGTNFLGPKGK